jgi:hypothetical protein
MFHKLVKISIPRLIALNQKKYDKEPTSTCIILFVFIVNTLNLIFVWSDYNF